MELGEEQGYRSSRIRPIYRQRLGIHDNKLSHPQSAGDTISVIYPTHSFSGVLICAGNSS
jgi:hypothetical protein